SDGTTVSDDPYAVLNASWVSDQQKTAARRFLDYVHRPEQMKAFLDLGFRDEHDKAGQAIKDDPGLRENPGYKAVPAPPPEVAGAVRQLWNDVRKPASVLMVIDVSGSMAKPVPGTNANRLQLAKDAALPATSILAPTDEIGLWEFSSGPEPWR